MLASMIERYNNGVHSQALVENYSRAAAELRRLHEVNAELVGALKAVINYVDDADFDGFNARQKAQATLHKIIGGKNE